MGRKKSKKNNRLTLISISILAVFSILFIVISQDTCEKKDYSICKIKIDGHSINTKVAYSNRAQQIGLMWVGHLDEKEGMIFVYDKPKYLSFWMKNTLIPLSIAFIEENGRISSIQDMYPQPGKKDHELALYQSNTLTKYAIETRLGWFKDRNIKSGTYIKIPKKLK
jgi:uncharacterized protein